MNKSCVTLFYVVKAQIQQNNFCKVILNYKRKNIKLKSHTKYVYFYASNCIYF